MNLAELRKRFLSINKDRLKRTRVALNHRQEIFLDALPLLFHCNHPMLPGFVSHSTPAGISGYKPDKEELAKGKALARSFCMSSGHTMEDIWGIYLMGSTGTLAQSSSSDFDVWLCHKPGLSKAALQELSEKCRRIEKWAEERNVEAHFFVMDSEAFKEGKTLSLDSESSGSAQRFLLLDEFYRTGLYISGRLPLWWFCPPHEEPNYSDFTGELVGKRFLRPETTLDFGGLSEIPPGEFVGAGIWQLYKAIESPYKSVLKLLLMEAYVYDYPNIRALALDQKELIYNERPHVDDIDPYLTVYKRIESYLLSKNDHDRLELARRCFYFKVNKALSKTPSARGKSWQRILMENLVERWGWSEPYVASLDERAHWKTLQVKEERGQLVQALNCSYEFLMRFAEDTGAIRSISTNELNVLGRKLQAAFERRPGKLEWVNPGISKDISENVLSLVKAEVVDESGYNNVTWQLFGSETGADTPLRQTNSAVELLLWSYFNGVVDSHTRFDLSRAGGLSETQVKRTLNKIKQWLPDPESTHHHGTFQQAAVPQNALMLINVGNEPDCFADESGLQRLSNNSDPFCYGGFEENLVASIDLVITNSWEEVTSQHFQGRQALLNALRAYMDLCMPGSYQAPPELNIECLGQHNAPSIGHRAKAWFKQIVDCYYSGTKPPSTRYIFELAGRYHSLQFRGPRLMVLEHEDSETLIRYLGESQKRYSPIVIDQRALQKHPLKAISKASSAKAIKVFYQAQEFEIKVFVLDERGSLMQLMCDNTPQQQSLNALHYFLRSVLKRQENNPLAGNSKNFGVQPIEFYEIRQDTHKNIVLTPKVIAPELVHLQVVDLQASVAVDEQGHFEYNFTCLNRCFSWKQMGQDVFLACAEFILKQRKKSENYPVHITDLDLNQCSTVISSSKSLQLSHYLRIKIELERKLSKALSALS